MVDIDVCALSYLKKQLAWAANNYLWVISTVIVPRSYVKGTKEQNHFKYCLHCYVALSNVTYVQESFTHL